MSNKEHTQKDKPNKANLVNPENSKTDLVSSKEQNNTHSEQENKQGESNETKTDQLVTGQSDSDVNGNELDKNLRHSPAH